jgi:phosphopantothenoylcysteine decarboxylase/phosphopantothenate--cysteine ligase
MGGLHGRRVLLGVSGGIAAYKAAMVARGLQAVGANVTAVLTAAAERFIGLDTFSGLTGNEARGSLWDAPGSVLHVELAHGADVFAIVPATANVIAKLANGLADDLLSAAALEDDGPLVIAPAMHAGMWRADATQHNVRTLAARGARFVGPIQGALAHGDEGIGRLSEPDDIMSAIVATARAPASGALATKRVVITAGPTHEPIDPVRFLGNRSSGKMGIAIASEALARGADVTLVLGPVTVAPPAGAEVVRVSTAEEMHAAFIARRDADVMVMAAAVGDFRPKRAADHKLKKEHGAPELVLEPTPDILGDLAEHRAGQILVGFAAETDDVESAGRRKLERKGADILVANLVGAPGTGFGADTNDAAILEASGAGTGMRSWTKQELARAVWDRVEALIERRGVHS